MYRRILVPLDGSSIAATVLPTVRMLAALTDTEVTLFQAVEPPPPATPRGDPAALMAAALRTVEATGGAVDSAPDDQLAAATERAHATLLPVAQALQHQGLTVHTRTDVGPAAAAIIAASAGMDLIAMASHGRGGLGRWVYGSVAEKVLQAAPVPVLLVRASAAPPTAVSLPRRILVPLDGSALAEQALPAAAALARAAGATITLLQSVFWAQAALAESPYDYGVALDTGLLMEQAETGAHAYLAGHCQALTAAGTPATALVRVDPAAEAILTATAELPADLIVMSTHGRGGVGRWVLGSVADRVLRGATTPILLLRSPVPAVAAPTLAGTVGTKAEGTL